VVDQVWNKHVNIIQVDLIISIGSGKGTQCEKIIEKYGFTHLSAGDLIRAAAQDSTTEKGRYFNEAMSQGKLVSTVIQSEN
jgi:adenylate kinase family enzyme